MMRRSLLLAPLPCLVLVGCGAGTAGPGGPAGAPGEPASSGTAIGGEYVADGLPEPFGEGDSLRVTFRDGEISFRATCNTFSGRASWGGGSLEVDQLGGTEMGCPGRGHDQDEWLVDLFTSSAEIDIHGTDVRLASGDTEIWLVPADEVAPGPGPDASLVSTRWRLTGIQRTDGDAVSMTMARLTHPALLTIEQGSIGFDTTCNTGGGNVRVVRDRLRLGQVSTTLIACLDERGEIERSMMQVLGKTWVDWSIDGNELRLTHGATALVYRAT